MQPINLRQKKTAQNFFIFFNLDSKQNVDFCEFIKLARKNIDYILEVILVEAVFCCSNSEWYH